MAIVSTTAYGPLALIPHPGEAPATETLEWLTDVIVAHDGSEQTVQSRSLPRQQFSYSLPLNNGYTQAGLNTAYANVAEDWAIPVWFEAQFIGAVSSGLSEIPAVTALYDFRAGGLALLWESPEKYQVFTVDSIDAETVYLVSGETTIEFTGAFLLPVRYGYLLQAPIENHNGYSSVFRLKFEAYDNGAITGDAPTQYLGRDLYTEETLMSGRDISENLTQKLIVADAKTGAVSLRTPWNNPKVARPYVVLLENAGEVRTFREFLHRRAGKYLSFWQPSFKEDLRPQSTGTVNSSLLILKDDYLETVDGLRSHIAVEDLSGNWYPREITSAAEHDADRVQINWTGSIGIDAAQIKRVCWLGLKRLDSDRINLNWPGNGVCRVNVRALEINP